MNLTRWTNLLAIGLTLSFAVTGCRTRPVGVTRIPGHHEPKVADNPPTLPSYDQPTTSLFPLNTNDIHAGWPENVTIFKPYTVHFDYDSTVIKSGDRSKVASVADYLKGNASNAVRVEGNCDERGTEEYNRSLGERRALAAREELIRLGIDPSRVDTKSWGEDNPANVPGHDESAWKQNRRGEFILLTPPPK